MYFTNNYSCLTKRCMVLPSSIVFIYPLIFGSKTDNGKTLLLFLYKKYLKPTEYIEPFSEKGHSSEIVISLIFTSHTAILRLEKWNFTSQFQHYRVLKIIWPSFLHTTGNIILLAWESYPLLNIQFKSRTFYLNPMILSYSSSTMSSSWTSELLIDIFYFIFDEFHYYISFNTFQLIVFFIFFNTFLNQFFPYSSK